MNSIISSGKKYIKVEEYQQRKGVEGELNMGSWLWLF